MTPETSILIGGAFASVFVVFHLFFWKLFRWKTDLAKLSFINRAVMQVLNLCLTFAFVIFAYISFAHTSELLSTKLGRTLLLLIAAFWYFRAVLQIVFFGLRSALSILFFVTFLVGGTLYALPLLGGNPPGVAGTLQVQKVLAPRASLAGRLDGLGVDMISGSKH